MNDRDHMTAPPTVALDGLQFLGMVQNERI
jgi:hypothetical protein